MVDNECVSAVAPPGVGLRESAFSTSSFGARVCCGLGAIPIFQFPRILRHLTPSPVTPVRAPPAVEARVRVPSLPPELDFDVFVCL